LRDLVGHLARGLSSHPGSIRLEGRDEPDGTLGLTLGVHPDDLTALIGRNGRVIRAIRALMAISSAKSGRRASLSIDALPGEPRA
jgi:predicted RNA-binding protein YlqC (UPF0109 family)